MSLRLFILLAALTTASPAWAGTIEYESWYGAFPTDDPRVSYLHSGPSFQRTGFLGDLQQSPYYDGTNYGRAQFVVGQTDVNQILGASGQGFHLESRLRVDGHAGYSPDFGATALMIASDGRFEIRLSLVRSGSHTLARVSTGGTYLSQVNVPYGSFNTYRLDVTPGTGNWRFTVDGVYRFGGSTGQLVQNSNAGFQWGDFTYGAGAYAHWERVELGNTNYVSQSPTAYVGYQDRSWHSVLGGSGAAGGVDVRMANGTRGAFTAQPITPASLPAAAASLPFGVPGASPALWDLQFGGSTSDAELRFGYDDSSFAPGFDESRLRIYHWNGAQWEALPGSVDAVNNVVTTQTNGFSPFALGYAVPEPSTWLLALFTLVGVVGQARRRLV